MNPYKLLALLIILALIIDAYAILYINGFKPTITSKEVKDSINAMNSKSLETSEDKENIGNKERKKLLESLNE